MLVRSESLQNYNPTSITVHHSKSFEKVSATTTTSNQNKTVFSSKNSSVFFFWLIFYIKDQIYIKKKTYLLIFTIGVNICGGHCMSEM